MNPVYEVLDSLQARLEPDQRAAVLGRILRVPAAWQALQQPEFLAEFRAAQLPPDLVPGHLASLALGGSLTTPLGPHLAGERSDQSGQAWERFMAAPAAPRDLPTLALLALEITLQDDLQSILRTALADPASWRDVLAVAWPGHPGRQRILTELLDDRGDSGLGLAVHLLLANMRPVDAARPLLSAYPGSGYRIARFLRDYGEADLAACVLQAAAEYPSGKASVQHDHLLDSEHALAAGDLTVAFEALQSAWNVASGSAADVADRMAELAAEHGDPVLASEATRRAMESRPTPERRAEHALSLLRLGRAQEAHAILPSDSSALEELIALGIVLSVHGQPAEAARAMDRALRALAAGQPVKDRWLAELGQALTTLEQMDSALQVARLRSERSPVNALARVELIQLLESVGDPPAAAQHARLAATLDPASTSAHLALARNLALAGEAKAALPIWEQLVKSGAGSPLELARCALAAGEIARAQAVCAELLELDPASVEAHTVLAGCLAAGGDHATAEARLRELISTHPGSAEVRLALADTLVASGQEQAAGEVLFAAAQAVPHEGQVATALSRWLRAQGRPSEALAVSEGALRSGPASADALIELGEASLQIGGYEASLEAFGGAARRQPGNWRARFGLARAYEKAGNAPAARKHLKQLPDAAPAAALIDAARITILAAEAEANPLAVQEAEQYLKRASRQSPDDPSIELWSARAHEVAGRAQQAVEGYQRCLARFASEDADSYATALLGIGRSAIATGELPLALSTLEQAQKRFPASSEIQCLLSQAYGSANLPEKAVKAAERAVEVDGRHARAWSTLGRARAAVGDLEGAVQAFHGLSSVRPDDPHGWMELAELAQAAQAPQVMRQALAEALWRGRRSPQLLCRVSGMLEDIGSLASALRLLRSASAAQPEDQSILTRLATLSWQAGDLATAHAAWTRLGRLDPQNAGAFQKSAEALWGLGRWREAITDWQRALELDPRNAQMHRALGKAYMQVGELQHGLNQYSAAMQSDPDDAALALEAGVLAMRSGAHLEAVGLLAAAVEGDPASSPAWAALGECQVLLGRWAEAEIALSRAVDLAGMSARVAALQVLAALAIGDLSSAASWLDQAGRLQPEDAGDVIWTARALHRMGDWSGSIQMLEGWLRGSQEAAALRALRELRFSVLEAHWIYEQAGARACGPETTLVEAARAALSVAEGDRRRVAVLLEPLSQAVLESLQSVVHMGAEREAGHSLVIGWLRAGHPETAIQSLEHVQPAADGFDWRPLLHCLALRELGRLGEALDALEVGAQDPVLRPLSEAMQAGLRSALGDREASIEAWNRALAAQPQEAGWHHALAAEYLAAGATDAGLPHLQQAVELAPGNMAYRLQLAKALAECGHSAEAVASFKLAIQRSEPALDQLLLAGQAALDSQDPDQAAEWYERAHALAPEDPRGLVGAARAAMARGKVRRAKERIEAALRAAPHDPQVQLGHGEILAMQGDFQGALQAFHRVRGASGGIKSRLIQAKSSALMALGQVDQAEHSLLAELERTQDDPNLWFPLATVLESKGDLRAAGEAAGQAVRLAPLNPDYRLALARICRASGNLDRALDELARARELAPADARVPLEQGLVYEERRDYRRALEAYRLATDLDARCTLAYYRSGLVLKQLKSYPQAGQMLKRAAELAPVDREVMHQLAAVRALELVHGPSAGVVQ